MNKNQVETLVAVELAIKFIKTLNKEELRKLINIEKKFVLVDEEAIIRNSIYEKNNKILKESNNKFLKENEENQIKRQDYMTSFDDTDMNEFDVYIRELSRFRSKEVAVNYLLDNKLTVTKLKILAKKLSIYIKSKSKKIDIIQAIVEGIVGSRLKLESLREY